MKKGQTEILGLAIVVVLVLVATTFVIRFLVNKSPADYRKNFVAEQLASNMVGTLIRTTTDCSKLTVTELLQDCSQSGTISCSNKNSCEFVEDTAKFIFSQTLDKWNYKYEFKAYYASDSNQLLMHRIGQQCKGDKEQGTFSIPTNTGNINVELNICL